MNFFRLVSVVSVTLMTLASSPEARVAEPSLVRRGETCPSEALGHDIAYQLYLPPDRQKLHDLPVIYLLHGADAGGADWLDQGHLQALADRLIRQHQMPRAIFVMPDGGNSWYVDSPPGSGFGAAGTALVRDLPDCIEARYAASAAREGRAIAGYSMGGFGALHAALAHPDRYAAAASMSGVFSIPPEALQEPPETLARRLDEDFRGAFGTPFDRSLFDRENPLALAATLAPDAPHPALLLVSGDQDGFDAETDEARAVDRFQAARIPAESAIIPGHHDWAAWQALLPRVLVFLGAHLAPAKGER